MNSRRPPKSPRDESIPSPERDPRDIVTEYAFRVDTDLLGARLAGPFRRGAAMLLDLAVAGAIVLFKAIGGVVFLAAVGWVLWRVSSERRAKSLPHRWVRRGVRATAIVVLLVAVGQTVAAITDQGDEDPDPAEVRAAATSALAGTGAAPGAPEAFGIGDLVGSMGEIRALRSAASPDSGRVAASRLALRFHRAGAPREEIREALVEIMDAGDAAPGWAGRVAEESLAGVDSSIRERRRSADSLTLELAAALRDGDTAAARRLRPRLGEALAGGRVERLASRVEELEDALEDAGEDPSLLAYVRGLAGDLGLGFGWLGLYFTAFLALWKGRTPGKRLLGIRVVKLDGAPVGWWSAFGRFGGYAAGLATGLLGFLQILWDPNRQALHDRIAGTVVVRQSASTPSPARRQPG